jgi:hypothetical protein
MIWAQSAVHCTALPGNRSFDSEIHQSLVVYSLYLNGLRGWRVPS